MFHVLWRIPLYRLSRRLGWPRMLPINLTLSPSPRCNSRCLTCNIWMKREEELTMEEWEKVLQSLGRAPYWVTISGGEPFLFPNLVPLAQAVCHYCRPAILNIPTNSLLYQRTPPMVQAIAESCPEVQIIINLSLDGVGVAHDRIRGVPGNFEKFERNYAALRELSRSLPNLTLGIHSVISTFNVDRVSVLYDYAFGLAPDSYITEIAEERVELDTVGSGITPSLEAYSWAIDELVRRLERQSFRGIARITQAFRLEYYRLVKRFLAEETQVIPCYAGWASAQIYADGTVWPCCVRADGMGNLREVGYDFKKVWFSPQADRIRRSIRNKECACPLANAAYTNMLMHPPTVARVLRRIVG
ncbi:MAG TPA: radical SAM protein [Chloroflexi bacterium]|nr:radical SAM protein [Chloroflexota bacterium]